MEQKKKKRLNKFLYFAVLGILVLVFIISAVYIASYLIDSRVQSSEYDELAELVQSIKEQQSGSTDSTITTGGSSNATDGEDSPSTILPEYQPIYEMNNDLVGWITVPDTKIDYPVMQTPSNTDYYLNHNFNKEWSAWGCIYARETCDINTPSDNITLYGHHMADGSMFAQLDKFKKYAFWKEHQTFTFDTLYEHHTYQIIAVFKTSAIVGQGFSYHLFDYADSEEAFNEFISTVKSLQMYETGLTAEYGDMLLTLSTCEYTLEEGRFVVVAKRIS